MTDLVNKEIRGITGRIIWAFLIGYSSILLSVMGIYFTSKNNFERLGDQIKTESANKEFRNALIEKEMSQLTLKQDAMQNQIYLQQIDITRIKAELKIK